MALTIEHKPTHLRVTGTGFFTMPETRRHFGQLASTLAAQRARRKPISVVVDLREAAPQSAEVAEYIERQTAMLYETEDQVGILVQSSILRLQLQRILATQTFGVFLEESDAEAFLTRFSAKVPQSA